MSMKISELFSITGKVALVTGGSSGIGAMIAQGYVENGVKVYISSRKAEACARVASELSALGTCIALPADVSAMGGIDGLVAELSQREPKLDILVNNAGATWGEPFEQFSEGGWDKVMILNTKSVFFLTQKLLPLLAAAGSAEDNARVINIGSIDGMHVSDLETYSYATSKAGVLHLTRMMAKNLAKHHIACNAIAPGFFPSKMTAGIRETHLPEAMARTPLKRIGQPHDMAGLAIYLASKASSFVCGSVIACDGGFATTA